MGNQIVTSVKVDEEVWKQAKKMAIDENLTLQELLNKAVVEWMSRHAKK